MDLFNLHGCFNLQGGAGTRLYWQHFEAAKAAAVAAATIAALCGRAVPTAGTVLPPPLPPLPPALGRHCRRLVAVSIDGCAAVYRRRRLCRGRRCQRSRRRRIISRLGV